MAPYSIIARYGLSVERLAQYEKARVLTPVHVDGNTYYEGWELRLSVIAKAEQLGFDFDEIVALITAGTEL